MTKIVCDTNVLISAFIFPGGKPDQVIKLVRMGKVELFMSPAILSEFERVVTKKFGVSERKMEKLIDTITGSATLVNPKKRISVIKGKDDDNRILECAVEARAEFIVSGDRRHLLPLKRHQGIRILTPAQFLLFTP